jgi:hypothetical protein
MNTHGGKRPGSGRKPGRGRGRTVRSSSITLTLPEWAKLDALRGDQTRSRWIAGRIEDAISLFPSAVVCSACGKPPKLSKTAIEGVMQLSHLCDHGSQHSFGEFASESELIALWNHQQND